MFPMRCLFLLTLLTTCFAQAQTARYDALWADPAVETRIREGIERHRKGDFTLRLVDGRGQPLRNVAVRLEQTGNDFLFGCNAFMVDGYDSPEKNRAYETAFARLFNYASVPFYWKDLEPQPGQVRFAANSPKIYRRPPPDAVLAFCQRHNLTPKGHTLVWNTPKHSIPAWLPKDSTERDRLTTQRIQQIAGRYGASIPIWDVLNEAIHDRGEPMPPNYEFKAFRDAARFFQAGTQLLINETTNAWGNAGLRDYKALIQKLLAQGARIDGIGLQFHFFSEKTHADAMAGTAFTPDQCFRALDDYAATFPRPIHVTEITLPTLPNTDAGRQAQATLARNFYRLWFSHPGVEAITWWNLPDGAALAGEDQWNGGLVNPDFSPKPAYRALDKLLNEDWKTKRTTQSDGQGIVAFRGFYGTYQLTVQRGKTKTEQTIRFSKATQQTQTITIQ